MRTTLQRYLSSFVLIGMILVCGYATAAAEQTVYYTEDWENGNGNWSASNGVWEVGTPDGGCTPHDGAKVAATNLDGYFPRYANSRLESQVIQLPASPADGQLWLHLWQWFSFYHESDLCRIEISVDGGAWTTIGDTFYDVSGCWSPYIVDLAPYAGQEIRIGFRVIDAVDSSPQESWGWYVDDIAIMDGKFPWQSPESFEDKHANPAYGGWYASRGVWEIGAPTAGPSSAGGGLLCAGTRTSTSYPRYANSRLISPLLDIPADPLGGEVWLSFVQWFSFYPEGDYGRVEILVDGTWSALSTNMDQYSGPWTECLLDLSPYVGQTVRIAFRIIDNVDSSPRENPGWYVDDVAIVEGPAIFNNPDGFEGGSRGWAPNNGVWQVGVPTTGPGSAYSGDHCWATYLTANYPRYCNSELLSSWVEIPATPAGPVYMKVYEWHDFYPEGDYGVIRIHTADGAMANLSGNFTGSSDWSQFVSTDLSVDYAGQKVRFGFYIGDAVDSSPQERAGWCIDDFEVTNLPQSTPAGFPDIGTQFPTVTYSAGPPVLEWFFLPYDPQYIAVYASRNQEFIPNLGNRIALLGDDPLTFADTERPGWEFFYRVTLIDDLWHESAPGFAQPPYSGVGDAAPARVAAGLESNYPNPFNPSTMIRFKLGGQAEVTLEVFDLAGRRVETLFKNITLDPGIHEVPFEPKRLASGLYFGRLVVDGQVYTKKMLLAQ